MQRIYNIFISLLAIIIMIFITIIVSLPDIPESMTYPCKVFAKSLLLFVFILGLVIISLYSLFLKLNNSQVLAKNLTLLNTAVIIFIGYIIIFFDGSSSPSSLYFLTRECWPW